jgi:hypothetical protein
MRLLVFVDRTKRGDDLVSMKDRFQERNMDG